MITEMTKLRRHIDKCEGNRQLKSINNKLSNVFLNCENVIM